MICRFSIFVKSFSIQRLITLISSNSSMEFLFWYPTCFGISRVHTTRDACKSHRSLKLSVKLSMIDKRMIFVRSYLRRAMSFCLFNWSSGLIEQAYRVVVMYVLGENVLIDDTSNCHVWSLLSSIFNFSVVTRQMLTNFARPVNNCRGESKSADFFKTEWSRNSF